jgi:flagellar biosynthesis protein
MQPVFPQENYAAPIGGRVNSLSVGKQALTAPKPPHERRQPVLKAVALTYDGEDGAPPRISATGRNAVARQILEIAFANGVMVREDADLAAILSELELDSPIPLEAFADVAEILAYVYRAEANCAAPNASGLRQDAPNRPDSNRPGPNQPGPVRQP